MNTNYVFTRRLRQSHQSSQDERELALSLCERNCQKASNWRRCIKNKCSTRGRNLLTSEGLREVAKNLRLERGLQATSQSIQHDLAVVQEAVNAFIAPSVQGYLCPLQAELTVELPESECKNDDFLGQCGTTSQCQDMYGHLNSADYDCKNSHGGVCYCGANEDQICGCLSETAAQATSSGGADGTCGKWDHQLECSTTGGCKSMYAGAYDCKNSEGGVCYCGDNKVCGCTEPRIDTTTTTTGSEGTGSGGTTPAGTCGNDDFKDECSSTSACRSMYGHLNSADYDCKNSHGGVCYCGENKDQVCGCIEGGNGTCGADDFGNQCATDQDCKSFYFSSTGCSAGGVCMCGDQVCGCK